MAIAGDNILVSTIVNSVPSSFAAGDIISVDMPMQVDQYDMTGFGDAPHQFVNGQTHTTVTIRGYLTTTPATGTIRGTHVVFRLAYTFNLPLTLFVAIGVNGPPGDSSPEFRGDFYVESYVPVIETGRAVTFTVRLRPAFGSGTRAPSWATKITPYP